MYAATHVPFGLLAAEFGITCFTEEADTSMMALAAVGALLPDVDHPGSTVGLALRWTGIPQYLEREFGHRTVTHSALFVGGLALVASPLALAWGYLYLLSLLLGVLSHEILDMANKTGVPLFWPIRNRVVFPPVERWRIEVGTSPEWVIAGVLYALAAITTPLSYMGPTSAFYRFLTQDLFGAAREARAKFPAYELVAQVRGTWRDSQEPADYADSFRVIAVGPQSLYLARGDAVFSTGFAKGRDPSITIDKILVSRRAPTTRAAKTVTLNHQLLDEVEAEFPPGAVVTGTLVAEPLTEEQKADDYTTTSEEFPTISFFPRGKEAEEIALTYCPTERLHRALLGRGIFVLTGQLTVTRSAALADASVPPA